MKRRRAPRRAIWSRPAECARGLLVLVVGGLSGISATAATASPLSDSQLEHCLRKGKIVDNRLIGTGVTRPKRLELECNGTIVAAAFKTYDEERPGLTRFEDAAPELQFTDSYRYEVAAYSIDRYLGLNMVPVVVKRQVGRDLGATIAWVEDAISPEELRQRPLTDAQRSRLKFQEGLMVLFDSLIKNVDRNQGNMKITPDDLRLHLIDHSRSFRRDERLSAKLVNQRIAIPEGVYERLRRLSRMEDKELRNLTQKSISRARSRAVISRAALIVAKIDEQRAAYGDDVVFRPLPPLESDSP